MPWESWKILKKKLEHFWAPKGRRGILQRVMLAHFSPIFSFQSPLAKNLYTSSKSIPTVVQWVGIDFRSQRRWNYPQCGSNGRAFIFSRSSAVYSTINSDFSRYQSGQGLWDRHSPSCFKKKKCSKDKGSQETSLPIELPGQMKTAEVTKQQPWQLDGGSHRSLYSLLVHKQSLGTPSSDKVTLGSW